MVEYFMIFSKAVQWWNVIIFTDKVTDSPSLHPHDISPRVDMCVQCLLHSFVFVLSSWHHILMMLLHYMHIIFWSVDRHITRLIGSVTENLSILDT